ncbi:MAG: hypothetical protein IJ634_04025 [Bacteroidales bacterium]|nr:hypothetical protein [Bacteroidales bacterium]
MKHLRVIIVAVVCLVFFSCDKMRFGNLENGTWEIVDGSAASHPATLRFMGEHVTIEYANSSLYPMKNGRWDYTIWDIAGKKALEISRITFDSDCDEDNESHYFDMRMNEDENIMTLGYSSLFHADWTYDFRKIQ